MNTLYIVRGLPGSGKSQFARKLVSKSEFVFEANKYMLDENGNYKYQASKLAFCHNKCFDNVKYAMIYGVDKIVVANTFIRKNDYNRYINLANKFQYDVRIITCKRFDPQFRKDVVNRMKKEFQTDSNSFIHIA
jgi:predicted kinase